MNPTHPSPIFTGVLAEPIAAFLTHKRALDRRYLTEEKALRLLDRYLVAQQIGSLGAITPAVLDAFLASRVGRSPASFNHLLAILRRLFEWMVIQELIPDCPVTTSRRRITQQRTPFIFNAEQVRCLLEAADRLPSRPCAPGRGATYRMIFALLYALGLRVGEVSRLCVRDLNIERRLLVIRQSKFRKTRLVPFGPRTGTALTGYLQQQVDRYGALSVEQPLFSFSRDIARAIHPNTISYTFHQLLPALSLTVPAGVAPPHLHCLRHSFAVGTLLRWYREGVDPAVRLIHLSTFLGHVSPSSTAVYLTITGQLLQAANTRFERFVAPVLEEVGP
jgi:site-specific recombinase XerD